ncbi:hypothetical protein [Actinoplanes sp. HUAS TT8]|uniref:hypothetical protein n=1 Tax=Actinoplanes sp. HUAS TT8 TaxID=3447453 RepID=UPI003F5264E7
MVVIVLSIWTASAAMFLQLSSPARTPRTRAWRFGPLLIAGFAFPLAVAYDQGDWSTVNALLVAAPATFAILLCLLRPSRA